MLGSVCEIHLRIWSVPRCAPTCLNLECVGYALPHLVRGRKPIAEPVLQNASHKNMQNGTRHA